MPSPIFALSARNLAAGPTRRAPSRETSREISRETGLVPAFARAASLALLVPALCQCGGVEVLGDKPASSCDLVDYDVGESGRQQKIEIATFWSSDAESAAFRVLQKVAVARDYVIATTDRRDRDHQQTSLKAWLVNDSDPLPDAFQVNGGSDVLQWVDEEETQLCPLTRLDERYDFSGSFFAATLAPVSCRRTLYGLPVGVHRLNVVFYNETLVERLLAEAETQGVSLQRPEELQSVEAFIEHLGGIAALGVESEDGAPIVPLALDATNTWPLAVLAFENVMAASGGELYEAVWKGQEAMSASKGASALVDGEVSLRAGLSQVVEDVQALGVYSNLSDQYREAGEPFHLDGGFRWQSALDMVASGLAAYTVMGDWGWAQVGAQNDAVRSMPFPGTGHAFIYTPDSFAVPRRGGSDGSGAHMWLKEVVADVETQIAFAQVKQSIPAVRGLSEDELATLGNERLAESYREFGRCQDPESDCQLLLAVSGLGPSPAADPCFDEVGRLVARVAGLVSEEDREAQERGEPRECPLPFPVDPDEAGRELVERLVRESREPFAADCRD